MKNKNLNPKFAPNCNEDTILNTLITGLGSATAYKSILLLQNSNIIVLTFMPNLLNVELLALTTSSCNIPLQASSMLFL